MSADRSTPVEGLASPRSHDLLIAKRQARGWARDRLAVEFERTAHELGLTTPERAALVKAIYRHETGRSEVRDELYVRLYCAVYELGRHELLGSGPPQVGGQAACELTSHKFVPVHLGGPDGARAVVHAHLLHPATALGLDCWRGAVAHPSGTAELFVFPWGVATCHLVDELSVPNLSTVAAWRRRTCPDTKWWARDLLRDALSSDEPEAHYVLSAYWLDSPPWSEPTLTTAMRLLATPRVLLGRPDDTGEPSIVHAEHLERTLLRDGFQDARIDEFGIQGVSVGCASWAAVSYCPLSVPRALRPADLIELEAVVQALWCFCHALREHVERGNDPIPAGGFGWRWLRGMRSRLTTARPNESAQHAAIRESVLATSGLADHLEIAVDLLRDCERS